MVASIKIRTYAGLICGVSNRLIEIRYTIELFRVSNPCIKFLSHCLLFGRVVPGRKRAAKWKWSARSFLYQLL